MTPSSQQTKSPDYPGRFTQSYLATVDASGTITISGNTVTVTVTAAQPTQLLGMVGISSIPVHGQGSAHPQRGVVNVSREFANSEGSPAGNPGVGVPRG
jgi:hypothetical protein